MIQLPYEPNASQTLLALQPFSLGSFFGFLLQGLQRNSSSSRRFLYWTYSGHWNVWWWVLSTSGMRFWKLVKKLWGQSSKAEVHLKHIWKIWKVPFRSSGRWENLNEDRNGLHDACETNQLNYLSSIYFQAMRSLQYVIHLRPLFKARWFWT